MTAVSFPRFFNDAEIDACHGAVFEPPAAVVIHVVPDDNFDDWIVSADIGQEFGHYLTREEAERVAHAITQERESELVVHLPDAKTRRTDFANSLAARLFRR